MNFAIKSLGCRLNMAEIQSVSTALQQAGHVLTSEEQADLHIINSCCVTGTSERKTRQLLYQSLKGAGPERKIIVTGCAAGTDRREGNVYWLSNDYKYIIPRLTEDWSIMDALEKFPPSRFDYVPAEHSSRVRINLKIQDGCSSFCSYCIIPFVRGLPVSRPADSAERELRLLVDHGYREFLLTGVCIGNYSDSGLNLSGLLEKLLAVPGDFRLHLSSISPLAVDEHLADVLAHDKMVRHLALSLQSGSDRILAAMNRRYTASYYMEKVDEIRRRMDPFNFTTDIITGFPGETEEDFEASLKLVKDAGFSHVHVFRYSERPGTKASAMGDRVDETVKKERSRRLMELVSAQKQAWYRRFSGIKSTVLSEGFRRGSARGFNEYYVPVEITEQVPAGNFCRVKTVYENGILKGTPDLRDSSD